MKNVFLQMSLLMLTVTVLAGNDVWAFGELGQPTPVTGGEIREIKIFNSGNVGNRAAAATKVKVAKDLTALHEDYQAYLKQAGAQGAAAPAFKSRNSLARIAGGAVLIDASAEGDPEALAAELRALGATNVKVFKRMVSGRLPLSAIPALNGLSSLHFARPAYARRHQGSVTSQGDVAMRADIGRTLFGIDGSGVKVGTLSDSYNCRGGAAAGVASGDLPSGVTVLEEDPGCASGTDEGRAMMEIIHDVAPGATLAFHTGDNGQAGFAQGIIDLATAGANVINDDVTYYAEPFYQDGVIAQAVDQVKATGVAYFSAAGNADRKAYEGAFRASGFAIDIGNGQEELHDFNPGPGVDVCQTITISRNATMILDFQWDQPFYSVSGAPGSANDMDILLTNSTCTGYYDPAIFGGVDDNLGNDPLEILGVYNGGPTVKLGLAILHRAGPNPGLMKMVMFGDVSNKINEYDTKSATSFGHAAAAGALGVGAAYYKKTPAFKKTRPLAEHYSSAGGTPILFDISGNSQPPEVRQQPGITAPDGVDTTFFGGSDPDKNGFPNFFGTSAAAPHAAGVAALFKEVLPTLTPDQLYAWMKASTIDMNDHGTKGFDKGFDFGTGFGLIQVPADLAVVKISAPSRVKGAPVTKTVKVIVQNRSPHDETIAVADLGDGVTTGLVHLNVNVVDDDAESCAPADVSLNASKTLKKSPKVLKSKKTLSVVYNVTYNCSAALKKNASDVTPGDYSYEAAVYRDTLSDGIPDAHAADDMCPRSVTPPFEIDPSPDGKIKDKGCGAKKADKTYGDPVLTNVLWKG